MALWADVLYACDFEWWQEYFYEVEKNFSGELWSQSQDAHLKYNVNLIQGEYSRGLGKDKIHYGGNSGYQAINLAYLFGAKHIYLLGFDMQKTNGESHWHGNHPQKLNRNSSYNSWIKNFDELSRDLKKEGVDVINFTRATALKCFKQKPLEELI